MSRLPVFPAPYPRRRFVRFEYRASLRRRVRGTDAPLSGPVREHSAVADDPVLERRRRISTLVDLGQRVGYAAFGLAMVAFLVGLVTDFGTVSGVIVALIVVGSIVLAPAIVFGYAVKAAERSDREEGRRTLADEDRDRAQD